MTNIISRFMETTIRNLGLNASQSLLETIRIITQWGYTPSLELRNPEILLKKNLTLLYLEYLKLDNVDYDTKKHPIPPRLDYEKISNIVRTNFPHFGFYRTVRDPFDLNGKNNAIEDAHDELVDLIKDLMEIQWRFEHTSHKDAIWHFEFMMRNHAEKQLTNLLNTANAIESKQTKLRSYSPIFSL